MRILAAGSAFQMRRTFLLISSRRSVGSVGRLVGRETKALNFLPMDIFFFCFLLAPCATSAARTTRRKMQNGFAIELFAQRRFIYLVGKKQGDELVSFSPHKFPRLFNCSRCISTRGARTKLSNPPSANLIMSSCVLQLMVCSGSALVGLQLAHSLAKIIYKIFSLEEISSIRNLPFHPLAVVLIVDIRASESKRGTIV
jgi:hypothetical protein